MRSSTIESYFVASLLAATCTASAATRSIQQLGGSYSSTVTLSGSSIYRVYNQDLTITASSGSGLEVKSGETAVLVIDKGRKVTVKGANADGASAAGAGIRLPSGGKLIVLGDGELVAQGGSAAGGSSGSNGGDGYVSSSWSGNWYSGKGGAGGNGGGGAGAGIGGIGGGGGSGGSGGRGGRDEFAFDRQRQPEEWPGR